MKLKQNLKNSNNNLVVRSFKPYIERMKINLHSTSFTAVKDIQIPDIYNNRIKSGIPEVDDMFGGGILPGSLTTISSKAGVGKCQGPNEILRIYADSSKIEKIKLFIRRKPDPACEIR
jgi:predicted ATP-dependent serine protease